ncbi:MAG TPA: DUF1778 domain-containing protein [Acidimicrobiia bacterium]|nr:DUF1778 domain-containing protein [Acidimicrobiia bacterium]
MDPKRIVTARCAQAEHCVIDDTHLVDLGNVQVVLRHSSIKKRTQQRDRRWAFRVKPRSDALVREAATLAGQSITAFVEESAVARAESVIAEYQTMTLTPDEFSRFVEALDEAPVAVPELVELFSRPSRIPNA